MEGRGSAKGNMDEHAAHRTQSRVRAPDALDRVREAARVDMDSHHFAIGAEPDAAAHIADFLGIDDS